MWNSPGLKLLTRLSRWPVTTQHGSRDNARQASSTLAEHRREQYEVDRFLAELSSTRFRRTGSHPAHSSHAEPARPPVLPGRQR